MQDKLYSTKIRKTIRKSVTLIEGILPFNEKPSENHYCMSPDVKEVDGEMNASDLFSLFTADIINQEIVFTR